MGAVDGEPNPLSRYELHPVPGAWHPFVRAIWTLDAPRVRWTERVPASLQHDLVFGHTPYLCTVGSTTAHTCEPAVHGLQPAARRYEHFGGDRLTGVQFHAGGLGAFLADLRAVRDGAVVLPKSVVWDDPDSAVRIAAVLRFLGTPDAARARRSRPLLAALSRHRRIREAASDLGTTERTLHRTALRRFGMGPKELQRVLRFCRAQELLQPDRALAEVALCAGYADQAHFSRAWRVLAGEPPSRSLT